MASRLAIPGRSALSLLVLSSRSLPCGSSDANAQQRIKIAVNYLLPRFCSLVIRTSMAFRMRFDLEQCLRFTSRARSLANHTGRSRLIRLFSWPRQRNRRTSCASISSFCDIRSSKIAARTKAQRPKSGVLLDTRSIVWSISVGRLRQMRIVPCCWCPMFVPLFLCPPFGCPVRPLARGAMVLSVEDRYSYALVSKCLTQQLAHWGLDRGIRHTVVLHRELTMLEADEPSGVAVALKAGPLRWGDEAEAPTAYAVKAVEVPQRGKERRAEDLLLVVTEVLHRAVVHRFHGRVVAVDERLRRDLVELVLGKPQELEGQFDDSFAMIGVSGRAGCGIELRYLFSDVLFILLLFHVCTTPCGIGYGRE